MEEKEVMLSIQGVQSDQTRNTDETQMVTCGRLILRDGGACLQYEEQDNDHGTIETRIEMDGDIVRVNRTGPFQTNFAFKKGCACKSVFMTPVGRLEMEAFPMDVAYSIGEKEGSVTLSYQMCVQGQHLGLNHIRIRFWDRA